MYIGNFYINNDIDFKNIDLKALATLITVPILFLISLYIYLIPSMV